MQNNILDDRGTSPEEARQQLETLLNETFDGEIETLALALGRPGEEIETFINGSEPIDEDLLMKIRGLAQERGVG
jgi:hypothetical protein